MTSASVDGQLLTKTLAGERLNQLCIMSPSPVKLSAKPAVGRASMTTILKQTAPRGQGLHQASQVRMAIQTGHHTGQATLMGQCLILAIASRVLSIHQQSLLQVNQMSAEAHLQPLQTLTSRNGVLIPTRTVRKFLFSHHSKCGPAPPQHHRNDNDALYQNSSLHSSQTYICRSL